MAMLIEQLLAEREGQAVDFKVDASSPRGIVKCFVAFSNTAGGWIVIGVDDDRNVVGLEKPQDVEQAVSQAIYTSTDPPQSPRISFATQDDKELVLVDTQFFQGPEPLKMREGNQLTVYERVGSGAVPVTDEGRLEQIQRERRGRDGFDQLSARGATIEDLDLEAIKQAFAAVDIDVDEGKLESFEIAVTQNDELVPTHAGLLLFGSDPRQHLPDAYFRAIRYPGADKSGAVIDSDDWPQLTLLQAIEEVEGFIARNTGVAQEIPGRQRREVPHYDRELLRELLHNAIAHADYSASGMHINVSIYSDRLVIDSPGQMPVGMNVEQLKEGISRIRNRAVMNVLHTLGYVEKHGTAYAKALDAERRGYPVPQWSEPGPILRVTLQPHPQAVAATGEEPKRERRDRKPEIIELLRDGEKSPKELREALRLGARQMRRVLSEMQDEGTIVPNDAEATSPRRRYRLTEDPGS
jgi:ATP-dependent DNA helicase RecG